MHLDFPVHFFPLLRMHLAGTPSCFPGQLQSPQPWRAATSLTCRAGPELAQLYIFFSSLCSQICLPLSCNYCCLLLCFYVCSLTYMVPCWLIADAWLPSMTHPQGTIMYPVLGPLPCCLLLSVSMLSCVEVDMDRLLLIYVSNQFHHYGVP